MKKLSQLIYEAEKLKFEVQDDTINYISKKELEEYLKIADKNLSEETKNICKWLIDNNADYISKLGKSADNALAAFYNKGVPTDESLKDLYKWVGKVIKSGRVLEIPVFQTEEQFEGIISKKTAPDEVILDLETEKGRNDVAKRYDALVHKIAKQFKGKSTLDEDELYSNGLLGLSWAMNDYGKPRKKAKELDKQVADIRAKAEEEGMDPDEAEKNYREEAAKGSKENYASFLQFAGWRIRQAILGAIENESHTVRIPKSVQATMLHGISDEFRGAIDDAKKIIKRNDDWDYMPDDDREHLKSLAFTQKDYEKCDGSVPKFAELLKNKISDKTTAKKISLNWDIKPKDGEIARSYDVSGDTKIGGDDQEGGKTVWDVIGNQQSVWGGIDKEETKLAKQKLLDAIHKKVGDRNFAWIENALKDEDDKTKLEVKDLAKKYGVSAGSISTVASKAAIQKLVLKDPVLKKLAYDWYQKFEESLHDELENTVDPTKPITIPSKNHRMYF